MADENDPTDNIDEEGGDDLCDQETALEEHEVTGDEELPAATGGVEQ